MNATTTTANTVIELSEDDYIDYMSVIYDYVYSLTIDEVVNIYNKGIRNDDLADMIIDRIDEEIPEFWERTESSSSSSEEEEEESEEESDDE